MVRHSTSLMYLARMNTTTRKPSPTQSFKCIQLGDVGCIWRGHFHLLLSAGSPLGKGQLGIHVPLTFKQLNIGLIDHTEPQLPSCFSTSTVQETGVGFGVSICPILYVHSVVPTPSTISVVCFRMLEPSIKILFELTGKQGSALVTKYQILREDAKLGFAFKTYTKHHYDSWVTFA